MGCDLVGSAVREVGPRTTIPRCMLAPCRAAVHRSIAPLVKFMRFSTNMQRKTAPATC
jgi:hypothetical protein